MQTPSGLALLQLARHTARPVIILLWVLILLSFSGCAAKRHFELGIYGVPSENFTMVKNAGFDVVTTPGGTSALEQARLANLKVLARPPRDDKHIADFDRHPALWGWYLPDEPDLQRIPPEAMLNAGRQLRAAGAAKPRVIVLNSGARSRTYAKAADILMVDTYPIGWAPLALASVELSLGRLGSGDQPYYAILQAFDWSAFPDIAPKLKTPREPTADELRCMTYIALAHEVRGIFYYTFKARSWFLPDHSLWPTLQGIVAEIRSRELLFTAEQPWFRQKTTYPEGDEKAYNEAGEERILLKVLRVRKGDERTSSGDYLLAINTCEEKTAAQIRLSDYDLKNVTEFRGEQTFSAVKGSLHLTFEPFEVAILGPLTRKKPKGSDSK